MTPDKNQEALKGPQSPGLAETSPDQSAHDQHFRTDHLLPDLKSRTVSSGFITAASQGIQFALTLVSAMFLARLLTPRDFGLLAMVWTIMGFLRVFKEAGLSTATVQREDITHTQVSNLFWVNVAVSGLISVLVAASAPLIAWFYREPRLIGITLGLSGIFLLAGLAVQHMAILNRQMRFKAIAVIQSGSVLVGVLVGIAMARFNCGYWSLVGLNVATNLVALLLAWSVCSWRPQFFKPRSGTRSLLHFGANLTAGAFIYSLARGLDGLLIGRFCGAVPLGLYSRASALLSRPVEQFIAPIEAVFIPVFSRLQTQPDRYRQTFMQLFESIALASFFFTGMFFALAHPLTLFVLGVKWEKSALIFAALCFAALQAPLGSCASWLITSQGRGKDAFFASWIISVVIAVSYVVGLPFGVTGVAISYSAFCLFIQLPIYYWLVGRSGPVKTRDLWFGLLKHLPVWAVVASVAAFTLTRVPHFPPLVQIAICGPVSLLAGIGFIFVYSPSRRVAANLLSTLRQLRNPASVPSSRDDSPRSSNTNPCISGIRVSVIIPTFNRKAFVVKAVNSVLNQTFDNHEVIVVDDGSTDGTHSALQPYFNRIKYIYQNNAGVSAARNAGIAAASGQWIAFLDSDDEWAPNYLARQMRAIDQNPDVCMQIADCRFADQAGEQNSYFETNGTINEFNGADYFRPKQPFVFLLRHLSWQVGAVIIRRDMIEKAGPFDSNFSIGEDQDFLARVSLHGPVGLLKDKLMTAHRRVESIENLSRISQTNPIGSRILHDGLYRKLESIKTLNSNEQSTMKWIRSANYRAMGNLFVAEGKIQEARSAYWMAVKIQPSVASIGKYLLLPLRKRQASLCPVALSANQTAEE